MAKIGIVNTDLQNCFGHPKGSLYVKGGELIVAIVNAIVAFASARGWTIIWSGDQHPPKTRHFKKYGGIWPVHGVLGTWGAQFLAGLAVAFDHTFIAKAMGKDEDGYSPICPSAFAHDGRSAVRYLEEEGFEVLVFTGLATDYCVKAGVLDALKLLFIKRVYLVTDAIAAVDINPGDGQKALDEMRAAGAILITSDQLDQVA